MERTIMKTIISTNIRYLILALTLALVAPACAAGGEDDELGTSDAEVAARARFELWQTGGQYYFHFLASNHEVLLASEGYQNRVGALTGMLSVLDNGGFASRYQVNAAADGQYYFNLIAANSEIIATSELYSTKSNASKAVTSATSQVASYLDRQTGVTGARFTVFTGANGRFYFRLYAKNGEIVLSSQGYDTEAGAWNGAYSVKDNGLATSAYPITKTASGKWHFNLVAANGEVIGSSELYASKQKAQQGRDAIIALLPKLALL
jgi:uncharacterized protein